MREVLNAPGSEYRGWSQHFERYPPGDWRTHHLLAHLICLIANIHRTQGARKLEPWMFCPEMESEENRMERQEEERLETERQNEDYAAMMDDLIGDE